MAEVYYIIPMVAGPYSRTNPQRPMYVDDIQCNWTGHNVDELGMYACLRLYIDANNRFHVATLSATKKIQYWYSDDSGATWTANHPGGGTAVGDDPVVGRYFLGKVRVYAHNDPATDTKITYWEGAGGAGAWGSRTVYNSTTGMDCTVNVRWSQYHHAIMSKEDIAYWKSEYPTNLLYVGVDYVV